MFQISNTRKLGDLVFHTAHGRPVILRPMATKEFEVEALNVGLLRVMLGKGSHYKVRADSEEAEALVKEALTAKKKMNGSNVIAPKPADFISIRDLKQASKQQPAVEPNEGEDKVGENVFIHEEQTPETPKQPPEKSPLEKLIESATELPFGDFRSQAKDHLGDSFPAGSPGRQALVTLLKEQLASKPVPMQAIND